MLTLVTGGAASGKSEYAERLAAACDGPRVYIATMRPLDKESVARIEKHRAARADRRFSTIEDVYKRQSGKLSIARCGFALRACYW